MSSHKPPLNNGLSVDSQWTKANSLDTGVKLAGEEAKDRLYEPKHKKKLVRVLTVIAYIFFVSLAAIMLSIYYVFLWNGDQKMAPKYASQQQQVQAQKCDNIVAEMQQQKLTNTQEEDLTQASTTTPATTEENTTWPDYDSSSDFEVSKSTFFKKLMFSKYPYAEND